MDYSTAINKSIAQSAKLMRVVYITHDARGYHVSTKRDMLRELPIGRFILQADICGCVHDKYSVVRECTQHRIIDNMLARTK